ncbi:hypothetical protein BKA65DRAFT_85245 [Rhexocercosporidium sp. MPI-PUGE-AT-0058]|nr:hypothetical protein BKA65DRAFT_85245 [Rhexocercosporidium sp. MPI-PUGE-AT-0058]
MKSLMFLSFLPLAFSSSDILAIPTFDTNQPIYLGESFYPPTMTFIAWQPTEHNTLKEWCTKSADCSDHRLFSLGGVEGLQIHDYFDKAAYLTRMGNRFADCVITPESIRMGVCNGVKVSDSGNRFMGPGTRKWTCWVSEKAWLEGSGNEEKPEEQLAGKEEDTSTVTVYETFYRGSSTVPTGTFTN